MPGVMGHWGGDPRSLTGIPMFVSNRPPDQHLPGHPLHGWEQVLCPVSLPKWWYAVGRDPAARQPSPHGLLQVGRGWTVSTEQILESGAGWGFWCTPTPTPPPRTRYESILLMSQAHTNSSSHSLLFYIKRCPFTRPFSFPTQSPCFIIIPRTLTSLISTDIGQPLLTSQVS